MQVTAQFPKKLLPDLFRPHQYKVLRGGRGSAKSWSVARALIIRASKERREVLCAREFQSSIRDSVHKVLKGQIEELGMNQLFDVQESVIYGPHASKFVFVGLSDKTAENLKSYEGFDDCWVEEAQVVSARSWEILLPTIRKPGSEVWVTFNPELDTDATWRTFIESPPPGTWNVEMNWRDNPWFGDKMNELRIHAEKTMPKVDYEHIWEGKNRPTAAGAIYADEVAEMYADSRVGLFPHDPHLLVHPVWDLGWNDKMAIGLYQRVASQLRKIGYVENDHKTLDWYSRELRKLPYNWGRTFLPHDGDHADFKTGKSTKALLEALGWVVDVLPLIPVVDGIRAARMAFKTLYVHRAPQEAKDGTPHEGGYLGCARWLECAKRYRRSVPNSTGEPGQPLHDEYSHGADEWRYASQAAPLMLNEAGMGAMPPLKFPKNL